MNVFNIITFENISPAPKQIRSESGMPVEYSSIGEAKAALADEFQAFKNRLSELNISFEQREDEQYQKALIYDDNGIRKRITMAIILPGCYRTAMEIWNDLKQNKA